MKIYYTAHARQRMDERNITHEVVLQTIQQPESEQKANFGRIHRFRKVGKQIIRITFALRAERYIIITVASNKAI